MDTPLTHGWVELPSGFEVELEHGIPVRVGNAGLALPPDSAALEEEIARETGLRVQIGRWEPVEGELEARLTVSRDDLAEVLRRLARASASVFVDRFVKAYDETDTDYGQGAFAQDFSLALGYCGLDWGSVDQEPFYRDYLETFKAETERLAQRPDEASSSA
ncbi:hypothetical protein [Pelomicrobium sp.]|jgi:hypothetical protein|uniref:hypothetical protein n=1 Tax=Pelomicrobium sp. TaxID=2815319 RepID=UPI002FDDF3F3